MEPADKSNIWHYNSSLKNLARANRREMTKAEACLWEKVVHNDEIRQNELEKWGL